MSQQSRPFDRETPDAILQRMIERVRDDTPEIDTREGSIVQTMLAPASIELASVYLALAWVYDESFVDTQTRDSLIKRCAERGIFVYEATQAVRLGVFTGAGGVPFDVPIGARFSLGQLNYRAVERIAPGRFRMACETTGVLGNTESGNMVVVEYIDGLKTARLEDVLIPGEDEEDTEALRQRYYDSLSAQAYGGNIRDYKEKVGGIAGVGGVKVYPVWNGGGTVRLVITDSMHGKPSQTLVDDVQEIIDPIPFGGKGVGVAPIGHLVTVQGVDSKTVDVKFRLTLESGVDFVDVKPRIAQVIGEYFAELSAGWAEQDAIIVRISYVETRILDVPGVIDIADTALGGMQQNMTLLGDEIPIVGAVTDDG